MIETRREGLRERIDRRLSRDSSRLMIETPEAGRQHLRCLRLSRDSSRLMIETHGIEQVIP